MIWYFKSNQKQNNRNRKEIKERERRKLPGLTRAAHQSRPSSCAGPALCGPAHRSRHRLQPPASRQEGVCPTRARTLRPPPAYPLAAGGTRGRHALPLTPCTSPLFPWTPFPPLLPSLHAPERSPSPPTPLPGPQPPPRSHYASLSSALTPWSYTRDARDQRRPQSTGASSSSSPVPGDRRRQFAVAEASPSPPSFSPDPS